MENVEAKINDLKNKGETILCGDFNARIGRETCMLQQDSNKFLPMPEDSLPDDHKT